MRVVLTETAQADLASIADYIARDNPANALRFIERLRTRCLELADLSLAFPLIPRHRARGIRRRPVGDYLIFYRVERRRVEVLHIVHGARDYDDIL
jgi:addiction module RelE/StbE family toxin